MRVALIAHNLWTAGGLSVGTNLISSLVKAGPWNQYLAVVPAGVGYEPIAERSDCCRMVPLARNGAAPQGRVAE